MIDYIDNIISNCCPLLSASLESHTFNDLTTKSLIDIVRECYNNFTTFFKYTLLSVIVISLEPLYS